MLPELQRPNAAYLDDEILAEVVLALEGQKSAGPSTWNALLSLVETCLVHTDVWYDHANSLTPAFRNHPLINGLTQAGVLKPFLAYDVVNEHMKALGTDYDLIDIISDTHWDAASMQMFDEKTEVTIYRFKTWLLGTMPGIFSQAELVTIDDDPVGEDARKLLRIGIPRENLIAVESWNRKSQAMVKLCRDLGLHLESPPLHVPHQLGAIKRQNGIARQSYERLDTQTHAALATEIGRSDIIVGRYPFVAAAALRATKGESAALLEIILEHRSRYRELRAYLENFEIRWAQSATMRQRRELQAELDNATKSVVKNVGAASDRLIYRLWHIVKNPTKILQEIGDRLVSIGRDHAVVGQVRGLRAFWATANTAPAEEVMRQIFRRMMPRMAPDESWEAADELARVLQKSDPPLAAFHN